VKMEELNKETLKNLIPFFNFADAIDHPEKFKELGLDPLKVGEIQRRLLTLSLEVLTEKEVALELKEEGKLWLIGRYIGLLGQCTTTKDSELHESILNCLMEYMDHPLEFANETAHSLGRLADIISKDAWESRIRHLVDVLETGDDTTSWNGVYALASLAPKIDSKFLQEQIGRVLTVARSDAGFRKAHAISASGKLYQYVNSSKREEILNTLLIAARDPDENTRRAAIFALENCTSDGTKGEIFSLFEDLLEDEVKMVKYGALEALTDVLPYKISNQAFDKILEFLKADEPWVRWRVALTLNKAYPELDAEQRERAVSVLTGLIKDKDVFVKVRAYEAFLNIRKFEKREFLKVDETLKNESDFVQHWVLYNVDLE